MESSIEIDPSKLNGDYIGIDSNYISDFGPFFESEILTRYSSNGDTYISTEQLADVLSRHYPKKFKFSPIELKSHDPVRHISISEAYQLVEHQNDVNLQVDKLKQALANNELRVYEFKGGQYLDRLDIGRVYHEKRDKKEGLTIERYFTNGSNPFESVGEYHEINLSISGADFNMSDAYFPKSWENMNSNNIVGNKYFFKPDKEEWKEKLKEKIGRNHEYSPTHLINRVTNFIADEGYKLGYFKTEEDRDTFADELKWLQINRKFAFNSPVQFNAGLFNEYGIEGSDGINYFRDPKTGDIIKIEDGDYKKPQCHACFIKGPQDNLESILRHATDEAAIFAHGSGIGQDIGVLRGEGEPLSGGGRASGALSFMKIYDNCAGAIKSGGKTRRAARLNSMICYHPDIMNFIRGKVREDKKALDLMKLGYEPGMDGEAVRTVTFQNTNISVRADDEFFKAVEDDGNIKLRRITDDKVVEEIPARRMLQEIAFGSWRIGDPAVQYHSKIQEMHPCKNSGEQQSSNPCSEYLFLNNTSCNLLSHNVAAYSDERGNLNVDQLKRAYFLTAIASDIINDAASYPISDIAVISPEFRTIGVGNANIGTLLMRKGLAYDSDEGRALVAAITALMTGKVYETSTELAEKLEPFTHYEFNKKPFLEVMKKHKRNLEDVDWDCIPSDLKNAVYESWENVIKKGGVLGFRNAQATVYAPTGTISFLMGADTTGIEPSIALKINKELAGGGSINLVNQEIPNALHNLGYNEPKIKDIEAFVMENNSVIGSPHLNPDHYKVFDTALGDGKGNGVISFEGHIRMLGAVQPFVSGAISKTCNLKEKASVKDIYDSFLLGHQLGLKALAIFRDESKPTSALKFLTRGYRGLRRGEKEELPSSGNSFRQEIKISRVPFLINVGEYEDGRPGEIVIESYSAGSALGDTLRLVGISASKALKRGVPLENVVDGWIGHKSEPNGLVTIDNPKGAHKFIKTALSPFDFFGKHLLLHYKGRTDLATEPDKVNIKELRGYTNGSFKAFKKLETDDWDFNQVMKDPELGGFVENPDEFMLPNSNGNIIQNFSNERGVICQGCGEIMAQTSPNCFECNKCGDKVGGCGM